MNEKIPKNNDNIIYNYLSRDFINSEESPEENEFNLETKIINKISGNFESKSQKTKLFEEYFNCKLKKIKKRNKNKPTPYQMFLKEKEYMKSMNNLRIQQNINYQKQNINLLTTINRNKKSTSNNTKNINNKLKNLALKNFSSTIYLNKIKEYKEKNNFYNNKNKKYLNDYCASKKFEKDSFNIHKNEKNFKNSKNIKLLDLISSNKTISKKELLIKSHENSFTETKNINKKNNFTNTFYNSKPKKNNEKFISYRNFNANNNFPSIYKRYNFTENSLPKNNPYILNIFSHKKRINIYNRNNKIFLKNKKDICVNKKSFQSIKKENDYDIIESKNKIKFFINEKMK